MDDIEISSKPLQLAPGPILPPDCGATSVFYGSTRADTLKDGACVTKLFYEAYIPMALKELKKICSSMRSEWEHIGPIRIAHRIGDVLVGEVSVVIAVSARRRDASIHAMEFAIEELKARVPIWKKEFYSNEESEWKANMLAPGKVNKNVEGEIDKANIQITASNEEIHRRIDSFAERKRLEVDRNNILEFCNRHYRDENDFSCARTDSVLIRRQGSSSHFRKSKVVNSPHLPLPETPSSSGPPAPKISRATEERLKVLEIHLLQSDKPVPKNIFERIKALEDRVLFLEGVSPEYFFTNNHQSKQGIIKTEPEEENDEESEFIFPKEDKRKMDLEKTLLEANLRIQEMENGIQIKDEVI
uniref:MAP3K12-binding inhibitory protein 1 n=1 Tax=Caligus rogercresseyi TaxID=217165 RepID=C1BPI4_CALRO|nr:MAP3K12-binding inhibitory protein 1 [Caligus rogercresseyi]